MRERWDAGLATPATIGRGAPRQASAMVLAGALILALAGAFALRPLWAIAAAGVLLLPLGAMALRPVMSAGLLLWGCVLLTPDLTLHSSLGLIVQWSHGLTLSNFLIPAAAVLVLSWRWLRGSRLGLWPLPRNASWFLALLAWGAVGWLPWLISNTGPDGVSGVGFLSLLAHWGKLLLMVLVAVCVARDGRAERWRVIRWFLGCMGINGLLALLQLAGVVPVFSPLARINGTVRVTGAFYDANLYGALVALALIITAVALSELELDWRETWGLAALALLLGVNLVFAASRAGYLALFTGIAVLALRGVWKPAVWLAAGCLVLGLLFPVRTWGRIQTTVGTGLSAFGLPSHTKPDAAAEERAVSMRDSLYQYARHPWLGLGFGRALYLGVPSRAGRDYSGTRLLAPNADRSFTGAQNMFLTILAETGPIGLLLYLGWLTSSLRVLNSRRPAPLEFPDARDRLVGGALMAGLAGLIVASCTIELFLNARILVIVLVLLGAWEAGPAVAPGLPTGR